jgi:hypothetical protein
MSEHRRNDQSGGGPLVGYAAAVIALLIMQLAR